MVRAFGCSIETIDREGNILRTLDGTGHIERNSDLSLVMNDAGTDNIDFKINSAGFLGDCSQYYNTTVLLQWDLDVNGSYESTGHSVTYRAVEGPATISIPVQAQHPAGGDANSRCNSRARPRPRRAWVQRLERVEVGRMADP